LASVDIVFTSDKSKWTRCPVIEMCENEKDGTSPLAEGGALKFHLRKGASVDKNGNPDGTGTGMGWFPGYAINVETGERLNIMFGENSWLISENGRDMIWNPTSNYSNSAYEPVLGGQHYIYIMGHNGNTYKDCPAYDEGEWAYNNLNSGNSESISYVYSNVMWVNIPILKYGQKLLDNDVKIRIRVSKPYGRYYAANTANSNPENDNYPMYKFNTSDIKTIFNDYTAKETALDNVRIVPNPYNAYSSYETNQLDNRIRITNLPPKCSVSIYTINGTLVRKLDKDDATTTLDWDLKNYAGIPISSGVYVFHIYSNRDGQGKKYDGHRTIKWFATMRPIDLNSY
jgi:hypothetical protein